MAAPNNPNTVYTKKVAASICQYIMEGMSIREIERQEGMPCSTTIFNWLALDKNGFVEQYTRAKECQSEYMAEEMLEISDDAQNDYMKRNHEDNEGWQENGEHIQRSRLRIETRKWLMSKMKPKKYGDKLRTEHSGSVTFSGMMDELYKNK